MRRSAWVVCAVIVVSIAVNFGCSGNPNEEITNRIEAGEFENTLEACLELAGEVDYNKAWWEKAAKLIVEKALPLCEDSQQVAKLMMAFGEKRYLRLEILTRWAEANAPVSIQELTQLGTFTYGCGDRAKGFLKKIIKTVEHVEDMDTAVKLSESSANGLCVLSIATEHVNPRWVDDYVKWAKAIYEEAGISQGINEEEMRLVASLFEFTSNPCDIAKVAKELRYTGKMELVLTATRLAQSDERYNNVSMFVEILEATGKCVIRRRVIEPVVIDAAFSRIANAQEYKALHSALTIDGKVLLGAEFDAWQIEKSLKATKSLARITQNWSGRASE
jgi:hypothetical protein